MDWIIPAITAAAGLGGSLIGVMGLVAAQRIAQRNENLRAFRRLAYEAAMTEWRTEVENGYAGSDGKPEGLFTLIQFHLAVASLVESLDPAKQADLAGLIRALEEEILHDKKKGAPSVHKGAEEK